MRLPLTLLAFCFSLLTSEAKDLKSAPKLVASSPVSWETSVKTGSKRISITLDQEIRLGFHSWLGRNSIMPEDCPIDDYFTKDKKTTWLNAKFEPGKVYVVALNERGEYGGGFQNLQGISMKPQFIVFKTEGAISDPALAPPIIKSTSIKDKNMRIDPYETRSLSITFDRPMNTESHGVEIYAGGQKVDLTETPFRYEEKSDLFTLDYQFSSKTLYRIKFNSDQTIGFRSSKGIPLWPKEIMFKTSAPSKPMNVVEEKNKPPAITESIPKHWALNVPSTIKTLNLTFDQDLRLGFTSLLAPYVKNQIPSISNDIKWNKENKQIIVPISGLSRGKTFVIPINYTQDKGAGFQSLSGMPTKKQYIVFRTSGLPSSENAPPLFRSHQITPPLPDAENPLTTIQVVFNRKMDTEQHGLQLLEDGRPLDLSKDAFSYKNEGTTLILKTKLKPKTKYIAKLNSKYDIGFQSEHGVPLWPKQFKWETKDAPQDTPEKAEQDSEDFSIDPIDDQEAIN